MFGAAIVNFLQTPTFVLNSKYDTWQGAQIIGAGACASNMSACTPAIQSFWVEYGRAMVQLIDTMPPRHGAYVHNCQSHCQTGPGDYDTDAVYDNVTRAGVNMGDAVAAWYTAVMQGKEGAAKRHVDRCDVLPCAGDICHGIPAAP